MTVEERRGRERGARGGTGASLKPVRHAKAASPAIARPANPHRDATAPGRVTACEQCHRRGSAYESRHRAD